MAPAGVFITIEGADGAGKSTQAALLAGRLRALGRRVVTTREPGGSPGAEEIRTLLVTGAPGRWSAVTEALLFTAARRDHMERLIAPELAAGAVVISDRFVDSTRVYQGLGDAAARARVDRLHHEFIGREADLTILLDLDPDRAAGRQAAGGTTGAAGAAERRFEDRGIGFQTAVRAAFRALAAEAPERIRLVDADAPPAQVAERVWAAACRVLPELAG